MGKRVNPHRRLLARQQRLRLDAALALQGSADRGLQEGRVRSPLSTQFSVGYHAPKFLPDPDVGFKRPRQEPKVRLHPRKPREFNFLDEWLIATYRGRT